MIIIKNDWTRGEKRSIKTINWHIISKCNYKCKFCSAYEFDNVGIDLIKISNILGKLKNNLNNYEIGYLNITGGEPTLHPLFYDILKMIYDTGIPTWISTNGSMLNRKNIKIISQYIEGISIAVDSISNDKEKYLGRGFGDHVSNVLKITDMIHETGIELGVNTIVTKINYNDNLRSLIHRINPLRWDIYQRLPVYQNNAFIHKMANEHEFDKFIRKHSHVRLKNGIKPSFFKTEDLFKSYYYLSQDGVIMNLSEHLFWKLGNP